jgi:hypothetical protein
VKQRTGPILKSVVEKKGSSFSTKIKNLTKISSLITAASRQSSKKYDPVERARKNLKTQGETLTNLEEEIEQEIEELARGVVSQHHKGDIS